MRPFRLLILLLVALLPVPSRADEPVPVRVELEAPAEARALLAGHLEFLQPPPRRLDAEGRRALVREAGRRIPELLATDGWFTPVVTPELSPEEGGWRLDLRVDPGPRATIAAVDLRFTGDLAGEGEARARRRAELQAAWPLKAGMPFRQADWDNAKETVLDDLLSVDYAAAALVESRAEVSPASHDVRLSVTYDSGPPYRLGPIETTGFERYPRALVERYNRSVAPGDPYRRERLLALQDALQATPYFASVVVDLDRAAAVNQDGERVAPVAIRVRERRPYRAGLGAGYSTNTGYRGEVDLRDADFLGRAWDLQSALRIEQLRQGLSADVFLPPSGSHRDSFGGLVEHSNIRGLQTRRSAVGVRRLQHQGSVDLAVAVNFQTETDRPLGGAETHQQALSLNAGWTWRRLDSTTDPRRGLALLFEAGGGSRALLSDQDFVRLHGRAEGYLPLSADDVLILRGEAGHTLAASRSGIPLDFLFRTGGAESVRGYAYQSLGVREGNAVVGGRALLVGSVEVDHWLNGRWGLAAFADAGDAADRWTDLNPAVGYGVGVRWRSPAGPLAFDVAYGVRARSAQAHFSLAIPF